VACCSSFACCELGFQCHVDPTDASFWCGRPTKKQRDMTREATKKWKEELVNQVEEMEELHGEYTSDSRDDIAAEL
jgi:hypothetical protein